MSIGLVLPYMLGLDVISFSEHVFVVFLFIGFQQKIKNKNGENLQDFLSLGLLGIVCILT
jgi:hypothetical protein